MTPDLVYTHEDQVVTDSMTLASTFDKRHDKVLRDIRNLKCSHAFRLANFGESEYKNKQGRLMPMYILTYEGFTMVAMGYTGHKAVEFKELFIREFKRTRSHLESRQNRLEMPNGSGEIQATADMITLRSFEQKHLQNMIKKQIHSLYPYTKDSGRRKHYAALYKELKKAFHVASFRDIRLADYEKAQGFIRLWGVKDCKGCGEDDKAI
ncbi:Rha family transcriptional regulator [Bacillus sp. A301a_S52]|nr:Rha family transcriptional regulator [Bacillus sp. A301a_S52]